MSSVLPPVNIGICSLDLYFPSTYTSQSALEQYNNVSTGKYTIGLGQTNLAWVNDRESIYSIALTAVSQFMSKYQINYSDIGRLEVASETICDHSKAIKTYLMQLFVDSGNSDIEGIDCMNACYAGTNALFNSCAWIESRAWDGRYAMVVAADIAEYEEGPARPTGGCGAVVMLIGPNAPIVLEPYVRSSHMEHAYDFYKPDMESPYPIVDGKFSNSCYLRSLDKCVERFAQKFKKRNGVDFDVSMYDYVLFHAPYNKLVQKSFARLLYNDFLLHPTKEEYSSLSPWLQTKREDTYEDVSLEKAALAISRPLYASKVQPTTLLPTQLGNLYTASMYAGLLSLVYEKGAQLAGKRILSFSYGSGLASSLFSFVIPDTEEARKQLTLNQQTANLQARLSDRIAIDPSIFYQQMTIRASLHSKLTYDPTGSIEHLKPGTYYLVSKDAKGRRQYAKK